MTARVAFRVDASYQIGSGHVMRCVALAEELARRGAQVSFICRDLPGHMSDVISKRGFEVRLLPAVTAVPAGASQHQQWLGATVAVDAEETIAVVREARLDWLVADHYALDSAWESALRPYARQIAVIDDLADRPHDADLLIDQNFHRNATERYSGLVPAACELLAGPRYSLLRPEFAVRRSALQKRTGALRQTLVFFGAADPTNETLKALQAIAGSTGLEGTFLVVVGDRNESAPEIRRRAAEMPNVVLLPGSSDMAELMATADLYLGAGGVTAWERCCLALPGLVIAVAENQKEQCEALAQAGCILYLGASADVDAAQIAAFLKALSASPAVLKQLAAASAELVDGRGTIRVANRLVQAPIQLRRAVLADSGMLFAWRNAEVTRKHFFDPRPLDPEEHTRWFTAALRDPERALLVGEIDGRAAGVIRYDLTDMAAAISVYIDPSLHGMGIGTALIQAGTEWVRAEYPHVRKLVAEVLAGNAASLQSFRRASFRDRFITLEKELAADPAEGS